MKQLLPKSGFARNALIILSGSALAQAIPIAVSPILTRLYTPSDFGLLALYTAVVSILAAAATGRYEAAVMLPEEPRDAQQVVALSAITGVVLCCLLLVVVTIFNAEISALLSSPHISNWLYLAPVSIMLIGTYQTLNYWLIRQKEFKKSAVNKLGQTSFTVIPSILMGALQMPGGLLVGYITGWLAGNLVGYRQARRTGFSPKNVDWTGIKTNAVRYQDMPKYSALPALLDGASLAIPVILVNSFFLGAAAGFFALTRQVILGPLSLISTSVSQVLFQHVVEKKNQGLPLLPEVAGIMWRLAALAVALALLAILGAPDFFALVFGEKWRVAGDYARILACAYAIRFVVSPLSVVFLALERVKLGSMWQILYFVVLLPLFFLGHVSIQQFLFIYAGLEIAVYLVYLAMVLHIVRVYDRGLSHNRVGQS
jgi:O-antigen/teichoic acid export membrane protein